MSWHVMMVLSVTLAASNQVSEPWRTEKAVIDGSRFLHYFFVGDFASPIR